MTRLCVLCLVLLGLTSDPARAQTKEVEFFEAQIRPLLAKRCYGCHAAKAKKLQAGLYLDSRAGALRGGDSGPAIVPGKPAESLLIKAVRYEEYEMPPDAKLPAAEVALLVKWIEIGAPWPAETPMPASPASGGYDWQRIRTEHWSFQPVSKPRLPPVADSSWPRSELDAFVLARLEAAGLKPARPADSRVLARRIYLDLIGIPPTPEEVDAFATAAQQDRAAAVAKLVNRLLESPHYGERWGRHWLDVARYSDGYGGFLDNTGHPHAWRYRDWVVAALNRDLPYDEFLRLQIAGDLTDQRENLIATGFFALGPTYRSDGGDPDSVAQAKGETLDDRVDTLSRGLLGLTVSCARCHDHKFDPIPQQDYYSLAGIFQNTQVQEGPLAADEVVRAFNEHQQAVKQHEQRIKDLQEQAKKEQRDLNADEQSRLAGWQQELAALQKTAPPPYDVAHALRDTGSSDMPIAVRGNLRKPGEAAPRRFLRILAGDERAHFTQGSGRAALAEAIADPGNPLTARVLVNRVWQHHFGQGLVRSPSNFGTLGERPTHPLLLDWLAATFIEDGWSWKALHRRIMNSATYQMSSQFDRRHFDTDGDNRLLWRMNPRRMDAETWRDALLSVTGELDHRLGGPPLENITRSNRRSLYAKVSRNGDQFASDEFLRMFDFPLMRATVAKRPTSIVPQQFLFMLNSPFMVERAKALAARLEAASENTAARIELAYQWAYARSPSSDELRLGSVFLARQPPTEPMAVEVVGSGNDVPALSQLVQYTQAILSSNEFMYVR